MQRLIGVDEMNTEMPSHFDVNTFKELKAYNKRVAYCNSTLQRLGSGSARIVYAINDNMALKLAKNEKGISQNGVETDYYMQQQFGDIITNIIETHPDDFWIIAERAKKLNPNRFKQLAGTDIATLGRYLHNRWNEHKGQRSFGYSIPDEVKEQLDNSEFVEQIVNLMYEYDMPPGDLGRISSFGEVHRNGKDMVVLTDYGLVASNYAEYYKEEEE